MRTKARKASAVRLAFASAQQGPRPPPVRSTFSSLLWCRVKPTSPYFLVSIYYVFSRLYMFL